MTLETSLSFTKPCTYRPLLSPELAMLNSVNWPKRSSLGGNVGRGRTDDTFARRKWGNLFAHPFCTILKQCVALQEHVALWELRTCRTFTSTDGFPMRLVPRCQLLMAAKGNQAVSRDAAGHPVLPGLGISLGQEAQCFVGFFSHCSALMFSQHANSSLEMLIRMPGKCFHQKWLIRLKYSVCLYLATNKDRALKH